MATYPVTGASPWAATLKTYIDIGDAAPWIRAPRVSDFQYPVLVAHRGGADIAVENTVDAYRNAVALGYVAVEAGDVQALSDGTLVVMHDPTVDRTTNGTGNVNTFTRATWSTLLVDYGPTVWGGSYVNLPAPFWDDCLTALAGRAVIVPEVKDSLDSTAVAMCDRLDALGVGDSVIVQSFTQSNINIVSARGYKTMMLASTFAAVFTALVSLKANNIWSVCVDYTAADFTAANVAAIQAAGFRVFIYTLDHSSNYATAVANGVDGIFTNEGANYLTTNVAGYRKTATAWHRTGRWEPGDNGLGDGPFSNAARGTLIGPPGAYRYKAANRGMIVGTVCPVANAAGTYTVTVGVAIDTLPPSTTGPAIYVAMPDDSLFPGAARTDPDNCYMFKVRSNGPTQAWEIASGGTATSLGTQTCTAMQNLTLTASMTGGATITTISVAALTVALKVGHQFMLPSGEIITVNAAAIIGATSLTILSFVPAATVANGSVLIPYVTLVINITPTTVTAFRGDETSVAAISAANVAHRGGYIGLSATSYSTGAVSYHKVTVT